MEWATSLLALGALSIAFGRFLDKFHFQGKLETKTATWVRKTLIALFVSLDNIRPMNWSRLIAEKMNRLSRVKLSLLFLAIVFLYFSWQLMASFFLWALGLYAIWGSPAPLWVAIAIQLAVLTMAWMLSSRSTDASLLFFLSLVVAVVVLTVVMAGQAPHLHRREETNSATNVHVLLVFSVPTILLLFLTWLVLVLKQLLGFIRKVSMFIIDGASNPKTDPFTYFGALFGIMSLTSAGVIAGANQILGEPIRIAEDQLVLRVDGIGPIRLGMTTAELSEITSQSIGSRSRSCFRAKLSSHQKIELVLIYDFKRKVHSLRRIHIKDPRVSTSGGLRIGDSKTKALSLDVKNLTVDDGAEAYLVWYKDGDFWLLAKTTDQVVKELVIGSKKPEIYPDGDC